MTAATSDVTTPVADTATAPTTGTTPADASGTAGTATLAVQDQTAAAAHAARRARKLDAFGFGLLGFGLVVFLGLFGVIAYDNSVSSQGDQTSVSTTP